MMNPENWQPADGMTLEPNALRAAKARVRCLALTAGPGAGKTEMLAQRADFLLRTGTCRYPKRILAISFKVDASQNLKERVKRRCGTSLSARFDSYTFHAFAKQIIDRFRPVLTGKNALNVGYTIGKTKSLPDQITFNDLIPLATQIIESSAMVRNAIRQTYSDVFLDEFQDCTNQQYAVIKLAFQGTTTRLTAVGDTKQKIMGWAGALEGIFTEFAHDFNAAPLNLYRNFRSQPKLLRMQNKIIKVLDPDSVMPDEQVDGDGGIIEVQSFENSQQEAESLAEQIDSWIRIEDVPPAEIAVLVSKQPELYAERLMTELSKRTIPFRNEQQIQDLSAEPITQLIVDYLLVLYGNREPDAYSRLMKRLTDFVIDEDEQSKQRTHWNRFIESERKNLELIESVSHNSAPAWSCAKSFLRKAGRSKLASLSPDYESTSRLNEVIHNTKTQFCDLVNSHLDIVKSLNLLAGNDAIRILTTHKSKGLEFDTVVMLGVEIESFWIKNGTPAQKHEYRHDRRCEFFVGISRAKRKLILTHATEREMPQTKPDRWNVSRHPHNEFIGYANAELNAKPMPAA